MCAVYGFRAHPLNRKCDRRHVSAGARADPEAPSPEEIRMALCWRRARRDETPTQTDSGLPATKTFVSEGCELSGELRFRDSVRIDGKIEGDMRVDGTVIAGETADIRASIRAECVIVFGQIEGDVRARRKIILHKTARVRGELQTAGITIEEGASFKGAIVIGEEDAPASSSASASPALTPAPYDPA